MNCKIAERASEIAAKEDGIEAIFVSLKDFDIPLYDGDLEATSGMPEGAEKFKQLLIDCKAFYIASPEYNSGYSGALKNAIDWASRGQPMLEAFQNKIAAISCASAGKFGGINGMNSLRLVLSNIGVNVIPNQVAIPQAFNALDDNGQITDQAHAQAIEMQVKQLCNLVKKVG